MNPASYAVSAAIGAVVFVIVGFLVYSSPGESVGFHYWITHPLRMSVYLWAMLGAAVGLGLRYVAATR